MKKQQHMPVTLKKSTMVASTVVAAIGWWPTVILLVLLLVFTFYLLAVVCDEALAPTLEELSDTWKIPHDVACATFLAAGSSAPEIFISLMSVAHGKKNSLDISLGTLMGSALIAYTVIPAACILVSPGRQLKLDLIPLARDVTFFTIGLVCLLWFASDSEVDLYESIFLVGLFFVYLLAMKALAPYYTHTEEEHHFLTSEPHLPRPVGDMSSDHHHGHSHSGHGHSHDNGNGHGRYGTLDLEQANGQRSGEAKDENEDEPEYSVLGFTVRKVVPPFHLDERGVKDRYFWILLISVFYVSVLSEMALYFAETLSDVVGISHHFTGLVLIALGAQIPDTVSSMAVAKHGEGPSSIANAIGSQVLNINLAIGVPFLLSNLIRGHPVDTFRAPATGLLVFGVVILFLAMVLLEKLVLKTRNAMVLSLIYAAVILGYGVHSTISDDFCGWPLNRCVET